MILSPTPSECGSKRSALLTLRGGCGLSARTFSGGCLAASVLLITPPLQAQEAQHSSLAGDAAAEQRHLELENQPYTFKKGDFRLLLTPSLELDYNDNINIAHDNALDDFILRPFLQLDATYPVSQRNLLQIDVGIGYDWYINHNDYSGLRLNSGSQVAFDIFVKDFRFDLHDRLEYSGDSAGQPSIAGNSRYEYFQNTAGLTVDWELKDLIFILGLHYLQQVVGHLALDWTQLDRQ